MKSKNLSSHLSKKLSKKAAKILTGWDAAIYDAEHMIERAKLRIDDLTLSINRFKEFRDNGEPFPGENKSQRERGVATD